MTVFVISLSVAETVLPRKEDHHCYANYVKHAA